MQSPAMIAATKMPLPVALSQLQLKTAGSGVAVATTGGTRRTIWSNAGTGSFGAEIPSSNDRVCGRPQINTTTVRMIQGSQASSAPARGGAPIDGTSVGVADSAALRSPPSLESAWFASLIGLASSSPGKR